MQFFYPLINQLPVEFDTEQSPLISLLTIQNFVALQQNAPRLEQFEILNFAKNAKNSTFWRSVTFVYQLEFLRKLDGGVLITYIPSSIDFVW